MTERFNFLVQERPAQGCEIGRLLKREEPLLVEAARGSFPRWFLHTTGGGTEGVSDRLGKRRADCGRRKWQRQFSDRLPTNWGAVVGLGVRVPASGLFKPLKSGMIWSKEGLERVSEALEQ